MRVRPRSTVSRDCRPPADPEGREYIPPCSSRRGETGPLSDETARQIITRVSAGTRRRRSSARPGIVVASSPASVPNSIGTSTRRGRYLDARTRRAGRDVIATPGRPVGASPRRADGRLGSNSHRLCPRPMGVLRILGTATRTTFEHAEIEQLGVARVAPEACGSRTPMTARRITSKVMPACVGGSRTACREASWRPRQR